MGLFSSPPSLKLPDYIDWDYSEIFHTISNKLGWTAHSPDAEHGDCEVDNIVHYFRYIKYPALIPEMLRLSKLVTCGQLERAVAKRRVDEKKVSIPEPSNLEFFLETLSITKDEMVGVLADPTKHMKYTKENSPMIRRLKNLKKKFLP